MKIMYGCRYIYVSRRTDQMRFLPSEETRGCVCERKAKGGCLGGFWGNLIFAILGVTECGGILVVRNVRAGSFVMQPATRKIVRRQYDAKCG